MMGVEEVLSPVGGQVYLTLNESPVYVKGQVDGVIEGGGRFRLAGRQTVDLAADFGFDYAIDDTAVKGAIEVRGEIVSGRRQERPRRHHGPGHDQPARERPAGTA